MQISRLEQDNLNRLIRWALTTSYKDVQPPDRVWQRIVHRVSNDHFDNIGESLGELLNYAQITRYEVFGDLTEEAQQAVESLGAQTLGHWDGFTR